MKREKTGGRKKGTPNKVDVNIRTCFELMLKRNAAKIDEYIDEVYKEHGAKEVLNQIAVFADFVLPKLSRIEQQSLDKDGNPTDANVVNVYIDGPKTTQ